MQNYNKTQNTDTLLHIVTDTYLNISECLILALINDDNTQN